MLNGRWWIGSDRRVGCYYDVRCCVESTCSLLLVFHGKSSWSNCLEGCFVHFVACPTHDHSSFMTCKPVLMTHGLETCMPLHGRHGRFACSHVSYTHKIILATLFSPTLRKCVQQHAQHIMIFQYNCTGRNASSPLYRNTGNNDNTVCNAHYQTSDIQWRIPPTTTNHKKLTDSQVIARQKQKQKTYRRLI